MPLPKVSGFSPFVVLHGFVLVLIFILLGWLEENRFDEYRDQERNLAESSAYATSSHIQLYVKGLRKLLKLYHRANQDQFGVLANNPENEQLRLKLKQGLKLYFPELLNFTISDKNGVNLLPDPESFIGRGCQNDIDVFSKDQHPNEVFIHSNPNPEAYHFDILSRNKINNFPESILFVSLQTIKIQTLLKLGAPENLQFVIVRRDKPKRIEINAEGTRANVNRDIFLSDEELGQVLSSQPISGTRWQIMAIQDIEAKIDRKNELRSLSYQLYALCVFISVLFLHSSYRRFRAEQNIIKNNQDLELKYLERTNELEYQATHDSLTGLVNRKEFERRLAETIHMVKSEEENAIIMYLDLDQFKVVNDTAGHVAGDELLRQVSSLLKSQLRRGDTLARLGGDEFGILLSFCSLDRATKIAESLRLSIDQYFFDWQGHTYSIGVSIGMLEIDIYISDNAEVMSLVDTACYQAKDNGRNRVYVYNPDDTQIKTRRSEMFWAEEALNAISKGNIVLHGQKIIGLSEADGIEWSEVLVRMKSNETLVYPDSFIPALERFGGIFELDKCVLTLAAKMLSGKSNYRLSVNISGNSVSNSDLVPLIQETIKKYHLDPTQLCFEITETATIGNLKQAKIFIHEIKSMGCLIALDDFGTGMSSFSYLKNLEVDLVKLDGSFVRDIDTDAIHYTMVESINAVSKIMSRHTIAEYVENAAVEKALIKIGVAYGQGYHLHKPEPLQQLLDDSSKT